MDNFGHLEIKVFGNKGNLKLSPDYDEAYQNSLINKAQNNWKGIYPDRWLNDL